MIGKLDYAFNLPLAPSLGGLHLHSRDLSALGPICKDTSQTTSTVPKVSVRSGYAATLAAAILIPSSTWTIRKRFYELFWLGTSSRPSPSWLLLAYLSQVRSSMGLRNLDLSGFGIWAFERGYRLLRLARHGIRKAHVTVFDDEYLKVEVPGLRREDSRGKVAIVLEDDKREHLSTGGPSVTTFVDAGKTPSSALSPRRKA
ncbi:hypothetical protein CFD26_107862 [Aspergillus turcosus]|uniref:Uncharacterized protein n=1 Tax=Aspergillus turcosus TaxID=1245748 RepID=A0A421D9X3_9EURO|nr:hypothetical protein CFD26_107862 [Aspergillus turcosus]